MHRICSGIGTRSPRRARAFGAFHRQFPVFGNRVPGMQRKYNLLWFVVDMHHRQRYFFICDCKQIVTKAGVKNRRKVAEKEESRGNPNSRFAFFVTVSTCRS
jgi:hypothetical protein